MIQVFIIGLGKNFRSLTSPVKKAAAAVFKELSRAGNRAVLPRRAEIFLVNNARMRALNRSFRKKDKTTNVLSFPADGFLRPDLADDFLGEVYLAPVYISSKSQDISGLVIHGLLHLFGYDHKTKNDRMKMESLEETIFKKLEKW